MFYADLDYELDNAIILATPEFASSLKRRFTNVGVNQFRNRKALPNPIKFENLYIRDNENRIELKNVEIKEPSIARMNEIVPNLKERHLQISADWYNIVLTGSYEMFNTSQIKLLPVLSTGDIMITIENIIANGLAGFSVEDEALRASNFDFTYNVKNVSVKVEYYNDTKKARESNIIEKGDIDSTIAKHIKNDLFRKLEESLRRNLDLVLQDYNLLEIFKDCMEMSIKYRKMGKSTQRSVNNVVDTFIHDFKGQIGTLGYLNLPKIDEYGLEATDGKVGDVRTLYRTTDFTYKSNPETHLMTIFGQIGLKDCQAFYKWSHSFIFTLTGNIKIKVGRNSMKLKLVMNPKDLAQGQLKFHQIHFNATGLDDLDISMTGFGLINHIMGKITTWISSLFKTEIVDIISKKVNSILQEYVITKKMMNGNGFRKK